MKHTDDENSAFKDFVNQNVWVPPDNTLTGPRPFAFTVTHGAAQYTSNRLLYFAVGLNGHQKRSFFCVKAGDFLAVCQ